MIARPPRNSVSRRMKKRTIHLLQNRTFLFVANIQRPLVSTERLFKTLKLRHSETNHQP